MCTIVNFKELARDVGGPAIHRHDQVPATHPLQGVTQGAVNGDSLRARMGSCTDSESERLHLLETELRRAKMVLPAAEVRARSL
jgi:hypothetical protein